MGEYTPTESDVREEWAYGAQDLDMDGNVVVSFDEALAQFDRFIARVKADALREALRSDETVERAAHGIHDSHDRGCHFEAEDHAVQEEYREMARAALAAAIGGQP